MCKAGNPNNVSVDCGDRTTRSRPPSVRKCCACQYNATSPRRTENSSGVVKQVARKRTSLQQPKPKKIGPDVLPSVSRARASVQLRSDALRNKPRATASVPAEVPETVTADSSAKARLRDPRLAQTKAGGIKGTCPVTQITRIRKRPAIPTNTTAVKAATPRQIFRKKVDPNPTASELKKPVALIQGDLERSRDSDGASSYSDSEPDSDDLDHITWDGFDKEPEYNIGRDCCFCQRDLAVSSSVVDNETEFVTLPVVAMLCCGHAFHVECYDPAESADAHDPRCVFCESILS